MRYRDEKFYWTYQGSVHWPNVVIHCPRFNDPVDNRKISGFH